MKRSIFFLTLAICLNAWGIAAQKAPANDPKALEVLNKASDLYTKSSGVKASFTLNMLSKGGSVKETVKGSIQLKSSRFKLLTEDMITWFDGTNQWVYVKSNDEVNLSKPSPKDMLLYNPINVYQLYKYGYSCKRLADKVENGKTLFQITLKPTKDAAAQDILVKFDKTTYRPVTITVTNKDKSGSRIVVNSYVTGQNYAESLFTFSPKEYPNTEVIDLR